MSFSDCYLNFPADKAPVTDLPPDDQLPYLEAIADSHGSLVTRITDVGSPILEGVWENPSRHGYSLRQPWNCDGTILHIDKGYSASGDIFLDGSTYEPLFARSQPGTDRRWHPFDPKLRVCVGDSSVFFYDVTTDQVVNEFRLEGYSDLRLSKGNLTLDGKMCAVSANGEEVGFWIDLTTGEKGPDIDLSAINLSWFGISPMGLYMIAHESGSDTYTVYGRQGSSPVWKSEEYGMPSHYDLAVYLGREFLVGVSKSNPHSGLVIRRDLATGEITQLSDGGYSSHTSCRNTKDSAWCFSTYNDNPDHPPYRNEVVAWPLNGSKEGRRVAWTHRDKDGYDDETHTCPNWDGSKLIIASNWGGGEVNGYVVDLCEHVPPEPPVPPQPEGPVTLDWILRWDPVNGASGYQVEAKLEEVHNFHRIVPVDGTEITLRDIFETEVSGLATFHVSALNAVGVPGYPATINVDIYSIGTPTGLEVVPPEGSDA